MADGPTIRQTVSTPVESGLSARRIQGNMPPHASARHSGDMRKTVWRESVGMQLLHGPYKPPVLKPGEQAECLFRGGLVTITGLSDARIPWPRGLKGGGGGNPGLLVDAELARAIRSESANAVVYWWGASITLASGHGGAL